MRHFCGVSCFRVCVCERQSVKRFRLPAAALLRILVGFALKVSVLLLPTDFVFPPSSVHPLFLVSATLSTWAEAFFLLAFCNSLQCLFMVTLHSSTCMHDCVCDCVSVWGRSAHTVIIPSVAQKKTTFSCRLNGFQLFLHPDFTILHYLLNATYCAHIWIILLITVVIRKLTI